MNQSEIEANTSNKRGKTRATMGRLHDTGMTFIPEPVHSIPIYFSVSVYMIPRRNFVPAQVIPE